MLEVFAELLEMGTPHACFVFAPDVYHAAGNIWWTKSHACDAALM